MNKKEIQGWIDENYDADRELFSYRVHELVTKEVARGGLRNALSAVLTSAFYISLILAGGAAVVAAIMQFGSSQRLEVKVKDLEHQLGECTDTSKQVDKHVVEIASRLTCLNSAGAH